jgi:hypothetical protein
VRAENGRKIAIFVPCESGLGTAVYGDGSMMTFDKLFRHEEPDAGADCAAGGKGPG